MYSPTTSLADPPADSPIADGVQWVQGTALGSTATAIAVLAVAAVGLLMLSGRLELRRGITVVLGCFILFGAGGIAAALTGGKDVPQKSQILASDSGPLVQQMRNSPVPEAAPYDPYAGASVPTARQK